jgi:hypothetical protein
VVDRPGPAERALERPVARHGGALERLLLTRLADYAGMAVSGPVEPTTDVAYTAADHGESDVRRRLECGTHAELGTFQSPIAKQTLDQGRQDC